MKELNKILNYYKMQVYNIYLKLINKKNNYYYRNNYFDILFYNFEMKLYIFKIIKFNYDLNLLLDKY